jgi:hypothetical protein
MTTTPQTVSADLAPGGAPNVYHLHGKHIHIAYYPEGSGPLTTDGPVKLVYQDQHQTKTFRAAQVAVEEVANLGSLITVVLQVSPDAGSTTATLLIPTVVRQGAQTVPLRTVLITTVHVSTLTGIGHPQRDVYTVTKLKGTAGVQELPL